MIGLPWSTRSMTPRAWPTAAMPSALATMATWLWPPPSSMTRPRRRRAVVVEQIGRAHGARDQHGVVRQLGRLAPPLRGRPDRMRSRRSDSSSRSLQPLVPVGVGLAQHARAGVVLHPLDGGLGRHAAPDRLVHAAQPAAVVGEHAVGLEHLAVLAGGGQLALLQHLVDGGLQLRDGGLQAAVLLVGVLGLELGDDHARLVQHDMPQRQALRTATGRARRGRRRG